MCALLKSIIRSIKREKQELRNEIEKQKAENVKLKSQNKLLGK